MPPAMLSWAAAMRPMTGSPSGDSPLGVKIAKAARVSMEPITENLTTPGLVWRACSTRGMSVAGFGSFRENRTPSVTSQSRAEMAAPRIIMKMPRSVSRACGVALGRPHACRPELLVSFRSRSTPAKG